MISTGAAHDAATTYLSHYQSSTPAHERLHTRISVIQNVEHQVIGWRPHLQLKESSNWVTIQPPGIGKRWMAAMERLKIVSQLATCVSSICSYAVGQACVWSSKKMRESGWGCLSVTLNEILPVPSKLYKEKLHKEYHHQNRWSKIWWDKLLYHLTAHMMLNIKSVWVF